MQTGTAEEATGSKTDRLNVAAPADPAVPPTTSTPGDKNKSNPEPVDPGAPVMTAGGPNEPDPSPWKGVEVGGPNEPDPSPWRGTSETAAKAR